LFAAHLRDFRKLQRDLNTFRPERTYFTRRNRSV
jgi:hypothetical protein